MRFILAFLLVLAPATARATPQDLLGYGARSPALAMTGVSYGSGYEMTFLNPAGLARARQTGVYVGLHGGGFHLELDGERYPLDGPRATTIGFHLPLPFGGPLEDRIVIGAAFYTPTDVVLRNQVLFTDLPQFPVLSRTQVVAVQVGVGVDFHGVVDGLRIGAGVSALADLGGRLDVRIDEVNRFVTQSETQLLAGYSPIVGVSYERGEWSFGTVYRMELSSEIGVDIDVDLGSIPVDIPIIKFSTLAQYDPHTLSMEVAWHEYGWLVALQGTLRMWGAWPGLQTKTSESSNIPPDPRFRTTFSPRLAMERTFLTDDGQIDIRAGYAFEPSPAPTARLRPGRDSDGEPRVEDGMPVLLPMRYLDNHRHMLTAGLGLAYETPRGVVVRLDVYGQAHVLQRRQHDIPQDGRTDPMTTRGFMLTGGWQGGVEW